MGELIKSMHEQNKEVKVKILGTEAYHVLRTMYKDKIENWEN